MEPQVGQLINNKYRLVRLIGDGGMGSVFEAQHEILGTTVALKFLHTWLSRRKGLVDRFLQEARVSARIKSPHVVRVTDVDQTPERLAYMVMEYVDGYTLQTLYERLYQSGQRLSYGEAFNIMLQLCEGVGAAHELNIVHRDLKPDNVMLTEDSKGRKLVKILDFGIAKLKASGEMDQGLTRPGVVMGTPEYMAPEQAFSADKVDVGADIFSLGVMFFEMLAGRRPVGGDNAHSIAAQYLEGDIAQLKALAPHLAVDLCRAVHHAMGARPENRFKTLDDFVRTIKPFAPEGPQPSYAGTPLPDSSEPLPAIAPAPAPEPQRSVPKTLPPEETYNESAPQTEQEQDSVPATGQVVTPTDELSTAATETDDEPGPDIAEAVTAEPAEATPAPGVESADAQDWHEEDDDDSADDEEYDEDDEDLEAEEDHQVPADIAAASHGGEGGTMALGVAGLAAADAADEDEEDDEEQDDTAGAEPMADTAPGEDEQHFSADTESDVDQEASELAGTEIAPPGEGVAGPAAGGNLTPSGTVVGEPFAPPAFDGAPALTPAGFEGGLTPAPAGPAPPVIAPVGPVGKRDRGRGKKASSLGSFLSMVAIAGLVAGAVVGGVYVAHELTKEPDETDDPTPVSSIERVSDNKIDSPNTADSVPPPPPPPTIPPPATTSSAPTEPPPPTTTPTNTAPTAPTTTTTPTNTAPTTTTTPTPTVPIIPSTIPTITVPLPWPTFNPQPQPTTTQPRPRPTFRPGWKTQPTTTTTTTTTTKKRPTLKKFPKLGK